MSTPRPITPRRRARFVLALAILGLVAAAEGWGVYHWHDLGRRERTRLQQAQREIARLNQMRPAPGPEAMAAITKDLTALQVEVSAMEHALVADGIPMEPASATRAAAFFEIAAFVEDYRGRARDRNIALGADATQFGFAAYAKEGPDPAKLGAVLRQLRVARIMLDALFEAGPVAIHSLRREAAAGRSPQSNRVVGPDSFAVDARWSVGVRGVIETTGLRIVFTGHTPTLRNFLNRLPSAGLLIRSVEVEPGDASRPASPASKSEVLREDAGLNEIPAPVALGLSQFTVTVEYAELGSRMAQVESVPAPTRAQWRPPDSSSRGERGVFELFAPPAIDPNAGQLATRRPEKEAELTSEPFGLTLVSVRREPFGWQLLGEIGDGKTRRGLFEHRATGEVFFAGPGASAPGVEVERLESRRERMEGEMWLPRLVAKVRDGSGGGIELVAGEECVTATLIATVATEAGEHRVVAAGDTIATGSTHYRVEAIHESPPSIMVTKESATRAGGDRRMIGIGEEEK